METVPGGLRWVLDVQQHHPTLASRSLYCCGTEPRQVGALFPEPTEGIKAFGNHGHCNICKCNRYDPVDGRWCRLGVSSGGRSYISTAMIHLALSLIKKQERTETKFTAIITKTTWKQILFVT